MADDGQELEDAQAEEQPQQETPAELDAPAPSVLLFVHTSVADNARSRLTVHGTFEVTEDEARIGSVGAALISTRVASGQAAELVPDLAGKASGPVIALAHPGGEEIAVELVAAGAAAVVAEGNEDAILAVINHQDGAGNLVETFVQMSDRSRDGGVAASPRDRDPATNLPGVGALEDLLATMTASEIVPRYGAATIVGVEAVRMGPEASTLLRRRLATQVRQVCRFYGADVFSLGRSDFAVVAEGISASDFDYLGGVLSEVTASFAPDRTAPLMLAMSHAGPESARDAATARELAERGLSVCRDPGSGKRIIGAEELGKLFSASTELEALLAAAAQVETTDPNGPGHGERVEEIVVALALAAGLKGKTAEHLRLAARLHEIGKIRLPADERHPSDNGEDSYRKHPDEAASILEIPGGPIVSTAVKHHEERWDGSGFPDGLVSEAIPLEARVLATAHAFDRYREAEGTEAAIAKLQEGAETLFDPALVAEAAQLFG